MFNAQDSVLWVNLRDAFRSEITAMYRNLRASSAWSYSVVENRFEEHQSAWSEAIFNEDARTKYLIPLIDPVTVDEDTGQLIRTDRYLTMLQGSKTEQRKWWLYNRFRYMDSKYNTGDASSKTINMRLFNGGTLAITPAIDMYVGVSFGGGTTPSLQRTTAGTPVNFTYTAPSGVTEMETWIYSADMITDVGDLSGFYPNELDFSKATRLRRLKVGSSTTGYANNNLTTLNVQNSALLEHIDCRNCPRLAISVNLEGSPRLKEAYFEGTAITGVDLADGATVETLHLPATITTLTLLNLNKLEDLTLASVANVTRLMLANMDADVIDVETVLEAIPANSQVYIEGLDMGLADAEAIDDFYDLLDTMRGVTREKGSNGEWLYHDHDEAQVSGRIAVASLTDAQVISFMERYPYIRLVVGGYAKYILTYVNYDGTVLYQYAINENGNAIDPVATGAITAPTKPEDEDGTYIFDTWDVIPTHVQSDQTIMARYTGSFRVQYVNPDGTLLWSTFVADGGSVTYGGSSPTMASTAQYTYSFQSWSGADDARNGQIYRVTEPRIITAVYTNTVRKYTVYWENADGTRLETDANVPYGSTATYGGTVPAHPDDPDHFVFTGFLPDGTAIVGNTTCVAQYDDHRSQLHKYLASALVEWENDTVATIGRYAFYRQTKLETVETVATAIGTSAFDGCSALKTVDLTATGAISIANKVFYDCNALEALIIRSSTVAQLANYTASSCPLPEEAFINAAAVYVPAALVDAYKAASNWSIVSDRIYPISAYPTTDFSTITDTWSEIVAAVNNGTYISLYHVGDRKKLDIDGYDGDVYVEIVAIDTDQLADNSGVAKITWVTCQPYFSSAYTHSGWSESSIRANLNSTMLAALPEVVGNAIKPVVKTSHAIDTDTENNVTVSTVDKLWIPSAYEMCLSSEDYLEESGVAYTGAYNTAGYRRRHRDYMLRSTYKISGSGSSLRWTAGAIRISNNTSTASALGTYTASQASSSWSYLFGFCM